MAEGDNLVDHPLVISITGSLYESLSLQKPGEVLHERVIDQIITLCHVIY